MNQILLDNRHAGELIDSVVPNLYYPRLQVNKRGEVVLATGKQSTLTTGILVGKTTFSESQLPIGTKLVDWEVCGELVDYDGEVIVSLRNKHICQSSSRWGNDAGA